MNKWQKPCHLIREKNLDDEGQGMEKKHLVIANVSIETDPQFTLKEFCEACNADRELIQEVLQYGVLDPQGETFANLQFDSKQLRRMRTLMSLQKDLEINLAGAALVVELLDELELLHNKLAVLQHLYK